MVKSEPAKQVSGLRSPRPKGRALIPREHGAYAEIAFPLVTALALGRPGAAQLLWVAAAVALFLAHEPFLVVAGQRGRRVRTQLGERAKRVTALWLFVAAGAGGFGWWLAPAEARLTVFIPLSLGALLVPLILTRREKSLAGELLVALAFASMVIPVALAGRVALHAALTASAVWAVIFSLGTVAARAVIARVKSRARSGGPTAAAVALSLAMVVASLLLGATNSAPPLAATAVVPAALVALACAALGVHPRHLRTLGWSMVATDILALAALILGLR